MPSDTEIKDIADQEVATITSQTQIATTEIVCHSDTPPDTPELDIDSGDDSDDDGPSIVDTSDNNPY